MEKQEFWIIKFDDADAGDLVFAGEGAEEAAQETYKLRSQSWNCHLFGPAELIATLRSENERLKAHVTTEEIDAGFATYENATRRRFDEDARKHAIGMAMGWLIAWRSRTQATQKGSE